MQRIFLMAFFAFFLTTTACGTKSPARLSSPSKVRQSQFSVQPTLSQNISLMNITTINAAPIDSKENYIDGHISIDPAGNDPSFAFEGDMKIKGRGNTTWIMPKKPYKFKLNASATLMGMPADKEWVLLANYSDKTLMRNSLAYEMAARLSGMPYAPRAQNIEVSLNGVSQGTYLLSESIKISPFRVNIEKLTATDIAGDAVTGGYLLELDQRREDPIVIVTTRNMPYSVKEPSTLTPEQLTYITNYLQTAEDVLNSNNFTDPTTGYAQYIDVDSFVDWFLVNEVFKNQDSANYSSIYFYKGRNQKLKIGPVWDYDLSAGNVNYSDAQYTEGRWVHDGSPWFSRLFQDPVFAAKVAARWNTFKTLNLVNLNQRIDDKAFELELTQTKNFQIWDILNTYVWPNPVVTGSYQGEVDQIKLWFSKRIEWMDKQFNPPVTP